MFQGILAISRGVNGKLGRHRWCLFQGIWGNFEGSEGDIGDPHWCLFQGIWGNSQGCEGNIGEAPALPRAAFFRAIFSQNPGFWALLPCWEWKTAALCFFHGARAAVPSTGMEFFPTLSPGCVPWRGLFGFFFISRGPALFWSRPLGGTTKAGFSHPLNSGRAREAGAWRPGWARIRGSRFGHHRDSPIWERWGKNRRELREGMPGSSIPAAFPLNSACIPRFLPPPADPTPSSCGS